MSRKADPKSVRQRALKFLSTQTNIKREVVIGRLMKRFKIGEAYSATLYAQYRTDRKADGTMLQVFSIRETLNGEAVEPYLKVDNVLRPAADDALTPEAAYIDYLNELEQKEHVVLDLLNAL